MQRLRDFVIGIETELLIIGASAMILIIFFGLIRPNTNSLKIEIENNLSEIVVLRRNLSEVSGELAEAIETITQLKLDNSARVEPDEAQAEIVNQLKNDLSELQVELTESQGDLNELQLSIECNSADQFTPNYSSNAAIATAIASYLGDTEGTIDSWRWNSIWDSSQDSIHYQIGEFQYVFLVYFEDVDLNNPNGVFWLDQRCWLDKAKN